MATETILLIVDAEAERLEHAQKIFDAAGFHTGAASSLETALDFCVRNLPPLIIVSVRGVDNFTAELCRKIRENENLAATQILQISPESLIGEDGTPEVYCGADAWLAEPYYPKNLLSTVQSLLRFRQSQETLRTKEERLNAFLKTKSQIIWAKDDDNANNDSAHAWEELTGQSATESQNMGWLEALHPEDRERVADEWQKAFDSREQFASEYRVKNKSGEVRYVSVHGTPIFNRDNSFREWVGTIRDITQERQAQDALSQQIALFQLSFEPIFVWDFDGEIVHWNKGCEQLYGYTIAEALGRNSHQLLKSEFSAPFEEFKQTLETTGRWSGEIRHTTKDGRAVTVESRQMLTEFGNRRLVLEANRDVTEKLSAVNSLRERENLLSGIADTSPSFIYIYDINDGRSVFANSHFDRVLGCNPAQIETSGSGFLHRFCHPEDVINFETHANSLRLETNGKVVSYEYRLRNKTGDYLWLRSRETIFRRDETGAPLHVLGIAEDITDHIQASEKLRASEERYRAFVEQSSEGIWRFELDEPVSVNLPIAEQLKLAYERGFLAECNDAMARMYGFDSAEKITGARLSDLFVTEDAANDSYLRAFIESNYRLTEAESHERDAEGNDKYFLNNLVGIIENGNLIRVWGTQRDITERKIAEREAREHQRFISAITETAPMMVIVYDLESGKTIYINRHIEQVLGFTPEELTAMSGENQFDLLDAQDVEKTRRHIENLRDSQNGEILINEYRLRHKNGEMRSIFTRDTVFSRDASGNAKLILGIAEDVTERKRAETILRENQAYLRMATESAQVGVWSWNALTEEVRWSDLHQRFWGYNPENQPRLSFEDWRSRIHSDDVEFVLAAIEQAGHEHAVYDAEYRVLPADDSPMRWMRSVGQFNFDENGNATLMSGVTLDITERKLAENAMISAERHAAEEYRKLLSRIVPLAQTLGTARDLITIYRAIGDFVRSSMPCIGFFVSFYDAEKSVRRAAYGWAEGSEIDVETLPAIVLTENGGVNSQAIFNRRTIVTGNYREATANRPHVLTGENNGIVPDSSIVSPMTVMGRVIGTLEVQAYESNAYGEETVAALEMVANLAATAIENVRLLEIEANARREAELANRSKDEFLAVLSHELRTPLNSMFGWVRMLNTGQLDEEKTQRALEVIERNINLQTKLIEDILDVSRIISGKIQLERKEIDLIPLVKSVIELIQPTAETKNLQVTTEFNSAACILNGDADRLQQAVNNLLTNAIKFTPSGGQITVRINCGEDCARLEIVDTGVGIEPDFLPYVFDRFRQADSTSKRRHGGLGLGLAIVRHLVEQHGGEVSADSRGVDKGSIFTIELPMHGNSPLCQTKNAKRDFSSKTDLKDLKLLVVDDDADALEMLRTMLESHGANVTLAGSAIEALRLLEGELPDVIISDIGMPEMNGMEFIEKLRESRNEALKSVPALALTAFASAEDRERILASGFDQFQSKPVNFADLVAGIIGVLKENKR